MKSILGVVVCGAFLLVGAWSAEAQTPAREGDTWGGYRHPPTEAELQQKESAAAVEATRSKEAAETATIDQIYRQLMEAERPTA